MIAITITCSYCGEPFPVQGILDGPERKAISNLKAFIKRHRWIMEFNGDEIDTYCSVACAKGTTQI